MGNRNSNSTHAPYAPPPCRVTTIHTVKQSCKKQVSERVQVSTDNAWQNAQATRVTTVNNAHKIQNSNIVRKPDCLISTVNPISKTEVSVKIQRSTGIATSNVQATCNVPAIDTHKIQKSIKVKKPDCFCTKTELLCTWNSWKKEFQVYVQSIDQHRMDRKNWGLMLLNSMGPVGQEICESFIFKNPGEKEDINVLMEKFDNFCLLEKRQRKPGEDIREYVDALQLSAAQNGIITEESIIKRNIMTEINKTLFAETAKSLLPTFIFSAKNFYNLTVKEIMFIWKLYEEKSLAEQKGKRNDMIVNCNNCGYDHSFQSCRAQGKQCSRCNEWNHFGRRCPIIYNKNCKFCGGSHFRRKCLAYDNLCRKCKRRNHFPWTCNAYLYSKVSVGK